MLTVIEAKEIGINACIEKLGKEFVKENSGRASSGYGKHDDMVFCFVGVDPELIADSEVLSLDRVPFPYRASCNVSLMGGSVEFVEIVIPEKE
jgi:hypothetical protein